MIIGTRAGMAIRFTENEVRPMGRGASGVRAIRLGKGDNVVGFVAMRRTGTTILVATENGFGKRSETDEYRVSHRGGKGIFTVKTTEKTGKMVAIKEVVDKDDVVIVTTSGIVIRQHAKEIRVTGRNTQGVRLIRLDEKDAISDVAAVIADEDDEVEVNGKESPPPAGGGGPQEDLFEEKKTPAGKPTKSGGKAITKAKAPEPPPRQRARKSAPEQRKPSPPKTVPSKHTPPAGKTPPGKKPPTKPPRRGK